VNRETRDGRFYGSRKPRPFLIVSNDAFNRNDRYPAPISRTGGRLVPANASAPGGPRPRHGATGRFLPQQVKRRAGGNRARANVLLAKALAPADVVRKAA